MKVLITLCLVGLMFSACGQENKKSGLSLTVGETMLMKHVYARRDTLKDKNGIYYRSYKSYMEIVLECNGKKVNDTIVNDSLNTIRYLLRQVDQERYTIELYKSLVSRLPVSNTDKKSLALLKKLGYTIRN